MRVRVDIASLRQPTIFVAVREVLTKMRDDDDRFRVCHISIQSNHLHYIVEAIDKRALSMGMRKLNNMMSRAINRAFGRRGSVFAFRYHATAITNPQQARNTLAYVLNNWRRHHEDEHRPGAIDPYSSGDLFDGWSRPIPAATFTPLPVSAPRTWLLREGWKRHGLINPSEEPGALAAPKRRRHRVSATRATRGGLHA